MKTIQNKYFYQDTHSHSAWDVRHLMQILADRAWLALLILLIATSVATVYLYTTPKTYSSAAVLYVEQRNQKVVSIEEVNQQDLESTDMMKTVEQSLTTPDILLKVIKDGHLAENSDFLKPKPQGYTEDELIKALTDQLKVKVRRGTRLIDISAITRSATLSQLMVQTLINAYQEQNLNARNAMAASANDFLLQEVDKLKDKLEKSESQLETYREQNNAVSLEEKQNIVVDTLKDLNTKLGEARSLRMKLQADVANYELAGSNPDKVRLLSSVATDPAVLDAQNRVADEKRLIAGLAETYRPMHPKYIDAQAQLTQLESALNSVILISGAQISTAYAAAQANEQEIERALKDQEQQAMQLDKIAIPYNVLARTVEVDSSLYQSTVERLKETDITRSLELIPVRIIAAPRLSIVPVGPKAAIILTLGIFAGIFGGIGLAVFVSSLDASMRSAEEAEAALEISVLATIPEARKEAKGPGLPLLTQPHSAAAEAFRSLRTVLELKEITDRQVLLFTSSSAGEGKTFCAVNCAIAMAQQGYKTLIIDTDLRHPSVGNRLGLDPAQPGLTDCLSGATTPAKAYASTTIPQLYVLTAGTPVSNCAELMSSGRLAEMLGDEVFFSYFDRIIFDTAPVNAVSDALQFVKHATAVCLVIRAGETTVAAARRAQTSLLGVRGKDLGIVLNRVAASRYNPYGYDFRKTTFPVRSGPVLPVSPI